MSQGPWGKDPPTHLGRHTLTFGGFPGGSAGKESACNAGDLGSIPGLGRSPGGRKWQPTPIILPGKSHGQRNLVGYGAWCHQQSDMTEQLSVHTR